MSSITSPSAATTLTAATPATRNRVVDATRAVAMLAVVVGHWLVALPTAGANGGIGGVNALDQLHSFQYLTWIFQVMPLVFVVGGFANAASLATSRASGGRDSDWVASRLRRLLKPTIVFASFWGGLRLIGGGVGLVETAAHVASVPLWFLAVYVVVVAVQPLIDRVWKSHRVATLVCLVVLSLLGDLAQLTPGFGAVAWLNHIWVFAVCQQLGVLWFEGRLPSGRRAFAAAVAALGTAVGLVAFGPWSLSLVYVSGQRMSNAHPPSIILLLMGVFQVCAVRSIEAKAQRWLQKPKVWMAVALINLRIMTVYLWHFTALIIASVIVIPLGLRPAAGLGSTSWWLTRPLWYALLAALLVGIVALVGRFESGGKAAACPVALFAMVPVASLALLHITGNGATAITAVVLLAIDRLLARAPQTR
jgi:surface polysaccharide O-acyltransferase-like enzyme